MLTIAAGSLKPDDVTALLLALAVLLGTAKVLGEIASRYKQPSVLGEILAGVILGPTLLGGMFPDWYNWLFPETGVVTVAIDAFTIFAALLLLLVAGLEVDLSSVTRQGKATALVSATGMFFPFVIGFGAAYLLPKAMGFEGERGELLPFALFVGIALAITALPVIAKVLMDLNMGKSDMGVLIVSSAMVNDLIGWIGFAMVLAMIDTGGDKAGPSNPMMTMLLMFGFLAVMLTIGRFAANRSLPWIQARWSWPGAVLVFVIVVSLLAGAFTEHIGVHAILGAFIAGVVIGDSRHLREATRGTIHQFVMNIFAPLFFATIGLRINFIDGFNPMLVLVVLVVACIGKIGGCYLGAKWAGMSKRESWAVGFGMVARGAMEIILGQLAYDAGLIGEELFVAIVVMALVTSLIAGPAMQKILRRREKRRLSTLITEKHFIPDMRARDAQAAIGELAERAASITKLDVKNIYDRVWAREQIMHTGLEKGLAVPHARLPIQKPVLILGRSERGIDFDATDGEPARLIFLVLTPEEDGTAQIEMLDLIARAFMNEEVRSTAQDADQFDPLLAALRIAEQQNGNHE